MFLDIREDLKESMRKLEETVISKERKSKEIKNKRNNNLNPMMKDERNVKDTKRNSILVSKIFEQQRNNSGKINKTFQKHYKT